MARILGMGNALMDTITQLPNDLLLQDLGLQKGVRQPMGIDTLHRALEHVQPLKPLEAVGGSAANIMRGIAHLGLGAGFIGKVGRDEAGRTIREAIVATGITPLLRDSIACSGHLMAFITPDGKRTYGTFLGAAGTLNSNDLNPSDFQGYDLLHIEGYIVQNHALLTRILTLAKENMLQVSLDLASAAIVDNNREFLHRIIPQYVDILLSNRDGSRAFTGKNPKNALYEMSSMCKMAVIRMGHHGAMARRGSEVAYAPAFPAKSVDGSGAGDLFSAGFLYALVSGWELAQSLELANYVASEVVQVWGTHIPPDRWAAIRARMSHTEG